MRSAAPSANVKASAARPPITIEPSPGEPGVFVLTVEQRLWLGIERVFPFFADAGNLEAITPPLLNFHILTPRPIEMKAGALIDYRLKIRGVPVRWKTRISVYEPPHRFVDEQLKGPYRLWHHTHTFEPTAEGGTLIRDRVRYALPRLPLAGLANRVLVKPDLLKIFEFRRDAIERLLPTM